jgi:AraC-like DNA-binding protein
MPIASSLDSEADEHTGYYGCVMSLWQTIRTSSLGRHSHHGAYAALVLSGGYEEAGDQGRFRVQAGDVILHDRFEAHLDRFIASGAVLLNLPLADGQSFRPGIAKASDPDCVVRAAEKCQAEAISLLLSMVRVQRLEGADWPDELAIALVQNPSLRLGRWGEMKGLAPWTVSRGFSQVFGVSPEAFRARSRARHAWTAIKDTQEPLARIAAHLGFADQPHMTRSVKQLTGIGPQRWRMSANGFKTPGQAIL